MTLIAALTFGLLLGATGEPSTVFDVARPTVRPPGAPKAADVIIRSMIIRRRSATSPHDTLEALRDFHATRLEWAYIDNPAFIAEVKAMGRLYGGAVSAPSYVKPEGPPWREVCVVDRLGGLLIAPWKRTWQPTLWGCVNNPDYESGYLNHLRAYLSAGAEIMQRDEPEGNDLSLRWGGCFCDHCVAGFRRWLGERTTAAERERLGVGELAAFDYRAHLARAEAPVGDAFAAWDGGELKRLFGQFQHDATLAFHQRTRAALDASAGRRVPISCNNGVRLWGPLQLAYDWAVGELSYRDANPAFLLAAMRRATELDRVQVVTMPLKGDYDDLPEWERLTRVTIAASYAAGGFCMVPWDTYLPRDAPRYFGAPETSADLYAFVRGCAGWLEGFEEAAVAGPVEPERRYGERPPVRLGAEGVTAIARVRPGDRRGPVVIHLIDNRPRPEPFTVQLDPLALYGDRPLTLRLLTPVPYDRAAHDTAERTGEFGPLVATRTLGVGRLTQVVVPALTPWGLLVVEPGPDQPVGPWQPLLVVEPASLARPAATVRALPITPATIRYALTGEPTGGSPELPTSLSLTATTTLRARAFAEGQAGPLTEVTLERLAERAVRPPDDPALRPDLALWLRADDLRPRGDGAAIDHWPAAVGPALIHRPSKLYDGRLATPPSLRLAGDSAAVVFDETSLLVGEGFANRELAGHGFTLLMVSRSLDDGFGLGGNSLNGAGGIPRLYLTRGAFHYDQLNPSVGLPAVPGELALHTFAHDGRERFQAWLNGRAGGSATGRPPVAAFGGGHLTVPLWGGNRPHPGELLELVVYRRPLTVDEREAVEIFVGGRHGLTTHALWRLAAPAGG